MPRIPLGEITLNFTEAGSGPPLVLLHGFPLDHQMWRHQIDALAKSHRIIAPDLRGFGQSSVTPGVVTMQRHAEDINALLDAIHVREPIALCGLSMGGYIAWQFVELFGPRLAKLILCDTKAVADSPPTAKGRLENAQKVLEEGPQALVDGMLPKLFAPQSSERLPDVVRATRKIMLDSSREGIAAALRGMAERPDVSGKLKSFDVPALVICGEHDPISTPEEMKKIAQDLPHGKFVQIAGAGHMAPLEAPEEVNAAMCEFLK